MIPEEFFVAVAEVLAFVFRTAGRRRRERLPERLRPPRTAQVAGRQNADDGPACESEARRFAAAPPAAACRHRPVTRLVVRGR